MDDDHLISIFKIMFKDLFANTEYEMDDSELSAYTLSIRKNYREIPYHNFTHALSVTHGIYALVQNTSLKNDLEQIEIYSMVLAALNHDVDHRGLNNSFQKNAKTLLARLYSTSIMENHHFNYSKLILDIMRENGMDLHCHEGNFLGHYESAILATDLELHMKRRSELSSIIAADSFDITNSRHRELLKAQMMTCSDLITCASSWELQKESALKVYAALIISRYEEFFMQGDKENELGIPSTKMTRRTDAQGIADIQIDFIGHIVLPAFELLNQVVPCMDLLDGVKRNLERWKEEAASPTL